MKEGTVRDAEGYFNHELMNGQIFRSRLTRVDGTNLETWAKSLLQRGQDAITYGFGLCHTGEPYDLHNFLCDVHGGDVPWNEDEYLALFQVMLDQPNFVQVMTDFKAKFGQEYFPMTMDQMLQEMHDANTMQEKQNAQVS